MYPIITCLRVWIPILLLSCQPIRPVPPVMGSAYVQYQSLTGTFRPLQDTFTLDDYVFEDEPKREDWAQDANPNKVDLTKIAVLVRAGKVLVTAIQPNGDKPVSLYLGYHLISDGGPNPQLVLINATDTPLIWMNANYAYCRKQAPVTIILKNYPPDWQLKWWFMGADVVGTDVTVEKIASRFVRDSDGLDYDAGFETVPAAGRSFRAPVGVGYVIVKSPADTYQVARVDVGADTSVTFTAP